MKLPSSHGTGHPTMSGRSKSQQEFKRTIYKEDCNLLQTAQIFSKKISPQKTKNMVSVGKELTGGKLQLMT
jgi:hypothetical protein